MQCPHWNEVELIFLSYNSIMRKAAHRSITLVLTDVPDDALSERAEKAWERVAKASGEVLPEIPRDWAIEFSTH